MIVYFLFILQYFFPIGAETSNSINKRNIALLQPHMHLDDIIKVLGKPIEKEGENEYIDTRLIYAKQGLFGMGGLRVILDIKNEKMVYFNIKEAFDYGFYMCDEKKCPAYIEQEYYDELIPD